MSNTLSGLLIFNSPGYEPKAWHSTVFLIAFLVVPLVLNLYLRKIINWLETIGGILHVVFFVGIITTLCTLSKRSTPEYVFKTLHTDAGWENPGVAFSIGMLAVAYPISSFDGVLHMNLKVHPTLQVPIPALFLVGFICCLLSLINLGSAAAFNSLVSLPTIALYISYLVPIALLTARQLAGRHPKYGPFQLGKWSIPIKLCSMVYLVYVIIFVAFPASMPVTSLTMNYAPPILIGFLVIAMVDWFIRGRKKFEVPTTALEYEEDEM
ncbi:hypothetical protein N0V95_001403 [Ascochyta clinopodiicola]|nr:hypothetical protein N0V95_001403 [Ascochyta clinopodiicola]